MSAPSPSAEERPAACSGSPAAEAAGMPHDGRYPLTRYFLLTGLVTAVVVSLVLSLIAAREVRNDLLEQREDFAVQLARSLDRQVREHFLLPTLEREGFVDLARPEHLAALDRVVRPAIADFSVDLVYFFDLEGRIVYSTTPEHVGFKVHPENANYWRAAGGQCSSGLVDRGNPLDVSGRPGAVNLLETYVPVYGGAAAPGDGGGAKPTGVIEIYQDATGLVDASRQASLRLAAIAVGAIAALMLALWLWIREAERTIDERSAALEVANQRLEALSSDLEQQVEDRTRRLLRAETLATVGTLGAGVAHEVNNPVAAIASCAEGLLRRADAPALRDEPAFADFPEYLGIIRDEAFRVKAITRNLLDFSRGGNETAREEVDLPRLLQATARLLEHNAARERKRIVLRLEDAGGPLHLRADPAGIRQLLLNVTVNALEACPEGGQVTWSAEELPDALVLTCADEGPGFSPEDLERALEPFYTRKPVGSGTGLGLAIAYGVARQHGGAIELGNGPDGRGARVVVRLSKGATHAEQG